MCWLQKLCSKSIVILFMEANPVPMLVLMLMENIHCYNVDMMPHLNAEFAPLSKAFVVSQS